MDEYKAGEERRKHELVYPPEWLEEVILSRHQGSGGKFNSPPRVCRKCGAIEKDTLVRCVGGGCYYNMEFLPPTTETIAWAKK